MHEKLISIALTTFNGEQYLHQQVQSLLSQTHKNIEIIIYDDDSKDNTFQILQEYAQKDSRIKLYRNEHQKGVLKNFEQAISMCKGDFIAPCDQDDIWVPDKLELLLNHIKDTSLIYHDDFLISSTGDIISDSFFKVNNINTQHLGYKHLLFDCWIAGHSMMFTRELLNDILPINQQAGNYDRWIALIAAKKNKIHFFNRSLVYWRQHPSKVSGDKSNGIHLTKSGIFFKHPFYPMDKATYIQWNQAKVRILNTFANHRLFRDDSFIRELKNYYLLTNRLKALIFGLLNINYIVQQNNILKKIKYILLPLFATRVSEPK